MKTFNRELYSLTVDVAKRAFAVSSGYVHDVAITPANDPAI